MGRLRLSLAAFVAVASGVLLASPGQGHYFPPSGSWESRLAAELGLDQSKLDAAIQFSIENQNQNTRNLAEDIPNTFRNEAPYNALIGPTQERTGMNGIVIRRGYVAAEWGDTSRADMTFSVTKTFLSTTVGEAYERGLIKDLNDPVAGYMPPGVDLFASEHNRKITWDHLLRQTSDWSGTLWSKPDWADRPPRGQSPEEWPNREMHEPGTFYKYNDTRVNVLALAALYVLKEPLPQVLEREVMDPIGASDSWHWEGYENSWVEIDGKRMQSVTGGGHFGGGMFISAWDMARFGYLFLNNGRWGDRQLVAERWVEMARTPGPANPTYGFMNWFLNTPTTGRGGQPSRPLPSVPESSVTFRGNGQNIIYIDWENDLVVVVRWLGGGRALDQFLGMVVGAID
jgi:CubicO group peptidase (beta-lactamase class C family)